MALWTPAPGRLRLYKEAVRNAVSAASSSRSADFLTFIGDGSIADIAHAGAAASRIPGGTLFMAPDVSTYAIRLTYAAHLATEPKQYQVWIDRARTEDPHCPVGASVTLNDEGAGRFLGPMEFAAAVRLFTDIGPGDALVVYRDLSEGGYLDTVSEYLGTEVIYPNGNARAVCAMQQTSTGSSYLETTVEVLVDTPESGRNAERAHPQWKTITPPQSPAR